MRLSPRFDSALVFAAQLHADQIRKGSGIPYISHLLAVAGIALDYGADEDEAIAALLHDAVEDGGGASMADRIRRHFGDEVADIVLGCSDTDQTPKPPWKERKEHYVAHLEFASPSIRLVSASDKLHNARAILRNLRLVGEHLWTRFSAGKADVLWYYRSLTRKFLACGPRDLGEELDRVVTTIETMAKAIEMAKEIENEQKPPTG